ncbi:MAG: ABC transporter ATP-binding protein [Nanoarchaeota archaeon]
MKLIELKEVSKRFGNNTVLEDVNLSIEEGDIVGIIGQSGSGKTTLLNLITGFLEPTTGQVLHSFKVTQEPADLNKNLDKIKDFIGFAPQHNSFYPKLTVAENLLHFGQLYGLKRETIVNNLKGLLKATELHPHYKKLAEQLSGGMQKRLDISCSLIHKPKVLVLDEPTADLDPKLQREIMEFLQEINKQGVTLVIASHHLHLLEKACNKIVIVHEGKLTTNGLLEDIRRPYVKKHFTISLELGTDKERILSMLGNIPADRIIDQGNNIFVHPAKTDVVQTIARLLKIIEEENLSHRDLDLRKPSLSDIFESITLRKP